MYEFTCTSKHRWPTVECSGWTSGATTHFWRFRKCSRRLSMMDECNPWCMDVFSSATVNMARKVSQNEKKGEYSEQAQSASVMRNADARRFVVTSGNESWRPASRAWLLFTAHHISSHLPHPDFITPPAERNNELIMHWHVGAVPRDHTPAWISLLIATTQSCMHASCCLSVFITRAAWSPIFRVYSESNSLAKETNRYFFAKMPITRPRPIGFACIRTSIFFSHKTCSTSVLLSFWGSCFQARWEICTVGSDSSTLQRLPVKREQNHDASFEGRVVLWVFMFMFMYNRTCTWTYMCTLIVHVRSVYMFRCMYR